MKKLPPCNLHQNHKIFKPKVFPIHYPATRKPPNYQAKVRSYRGVAADYDKDYRILLQGVPRTTTRTRNVCIQSRYRTLREEER